MKSLVFSRILGVWGLIGAALLMAAPQVEVPPVTKPAPPPSAKPAPPPVAEPQSPPAGNAQSEAVRQANAEFQAELERIKNDPELARNPRKRLALEEALRQKHEKKLAELKKAGGAAPPTEDATGKGPGGRGRGRPVFVPGQPPVAPLPKAPLTPEQVQQAEKAKADAGRDAGLAAAKSEYDAALAQAKVQFANDPAQFADRAQKLRTQYDDKVRAILATHAARMKALGIAPAPPAPKKEG